MWQTVSQTIVVLLADIDENKLSCFYLSFLTICFAWMKRMQALCYIKTLTPQKYVIMYLFIKNEIVSEVLYLSS